MMKYHSQKVPPELVSQDFQNRQLSLFQNFLCNTEHSRQQLSNAIELWDSIPRYSVSRQAMVKKRDPSGFLGLLKLDFEFHRTKFTIQIQPALVEDKNTGLTTAYYPSANEELVEEALRKLAADQGHGFLDKEKFRSGVVFSLYQLREELKRRGHTRSFDEIILSLEILSGSSIQIFASTEQSRSYAKSAYLPMLSSVTRKQLKCDPSARWVAQFHPLVTASIADFSYRQYNYHQFMSHSAQLTRWLHKLLIVKCIGASRTKPFVVHYTTIRRDSAMLNNYARPRKAIEACDFSVNELKQNGLLIDIDRKTKSGPRGRILDVIYSLTPSDKFVSEVRAASMRQSNVKAPANGKKLSTANIMR